MGRATEQCLTSQVAYVKSCSWEGPGLEERSSAARWLEEGSRAAAGQTGQPGASAVCEGGARKVEPPSGPPPGLELLGPPPGFAPIAPCEPSGEPAAAAASDREESSPPGLGPIAPLRVFEPIAPCESSGESTESTAAHSDRESSPAESSSACDPSADGGAFCGLTTADVAWQMPAGMSQDWLLQAGGAARAAAFTGMTGDVRRLPRDGAGCRAWQAGGAGCRAWQVPAGLSPDRLLEDLEAGGAARAAAVASLVGDVRRLSMDGAGCRVVQRALEVSDYATAALLVQDLHGHVCDLIRSPHGNYVVQKAVEVLAPAGLAGFVAWELRGCAAQVARHRFGCRVIIRLIEYGADTFANTDRAALVEELLADLGGLCRHSFGFHVIKAILGDQSRPGAHPKQQQRVLDFLCTRAVDRALDRFQSYVVEAALDSRPAEQAEPLVHALLGDSPANVIALSQNRHGVDILRVLLRRSPRALDLLREAAPKLGQTQGVDRLLWDAGLSA